MALLIGKSAGGWSIHVDDYDRARDGLLRTRKFMENAPRQCRPTCIVLETNAEQQVRAYADVIL